MPKNVVNFVPDRIIYEGDDFGRDTVANGDYDFTLDGNGPLNVLVAYFNFVDTGGALVEATAGNVAITVDTGNGVFQSLTDGTFAADQAHVGTRNMPRGSGAPHIMRITLSGTVVAPNVTGFRFRVDQSANLG